MTMSKDQQYCDECGQPIANGKAAAVASLPCDIHSANKGESATLCVACMTEIMSDSDPNTGMQYGDLT